MEERIQKIISAAGIVSRRAAEELIRDGRVRINGTVVTELGTKADPDKDHIKVDGKLINPQQPKTYVMLNKPVGFVTTMSDPEGRPVVAELLKGVRVRVYPVGRLDYNTEGLLLLTNDGDFAHLVTHPRHELPKTYLVKVKGVLSDNDVENLERGVFLKDGKTAPARVRRLRKEEANSWVEITIHEGRKRQVRRMIDYTGHSVIKLKRTKVGTLNLGDLEIGAFRHLTPEEVRSLQEASQSEQAFEITAPPAEIRKERPAAKPRDRKTRTMRVDTIEAIEFTPRKKRRMASHAAAASAPRDRKDYAPAESKRPRQGERSERSSFSKRPEGSSSGGFRPRTSSRGSWQEGRPERREVRGGESKRPWQGERSERSSFSKRPEGSSSGGFRPRTSSRGSWQEGRPERRETRGGANKRPWQGERSERSSFSKRPEGSSSGGFRPRTSSRGSWQESRPERREARGGADKRPWKGEKQESRFPYTAKERSPRSSGSGRPSELGAKRFSKPKPGGFRSTRPSGKGRRT